MWPTSSPRICRTSTATTRARSPSRATARRCARAARPAKPTRCTRARSCTTPTPAPTIPARASASRSSADYARSRVVSPIAAMMKTITPTIQTFHLAWAESASQKPEMKSHTAISALIALKAWVPAGFGEPRQREDEDDRAADDRVPGGVGAGVAEDPRGEDQPDPREHVQAGDANDLVTPVRVAGGRGLVRPGLAGEAAYGLVTVLRGGVGAGFALCHGSLLGLGFTAVFPAAREARGCLVARATARVRRLT